MKDGSPDPYQSNFPPFDKRAQYFSISLAPHRIFFRHCDLRKLEHLLHRPIKDSGFLRLPKKLIFWVSTCTNWKDYSFESLYPTLEKKLIIFNRFRNSCPKRSMLNAQNAHCSFRWGPASLLYQSFTKVIQALTSTEEYRYTKSILTFSVYFTSYLHSLCKILPHICEFCATWK